VNGQLLNFEVVSLIDGVFSMTDRETGTCGHTSTEYHYQAHCSESVLRFLPMQITTWEEWQRLYPHTTVLDWVTGSGPPTQGGMGK
jgi:hypothetical protein